MRKNYGLDIEKERLERSPQDWVRGGDYTLVCLTKIPPEDRIHYLPQGEVQKGAEDTQDCATRGPLNILEAKFSWLYQNDGISKENLKWLEDNNYVDPDHGWITFSDAFVAINSGTTRFGNSLKAPLEAIRKQGLIPKKMLPLEEWMTFDDYIDKNRITTQMMDLGEEFARRFTINYEQVYAIHFIHALDEDYLDVAGYAWPDPVDGVYPRSEDPFNHCFILVKKPAHVAFDNYIDDVDGDFIKKLSTDYKFMEYGYRIVVSKEGVPVKKTWLKKLLCGIF